MIRVFDYKCNECGHIEEHVVRSLDAKPKCPKCGSRDNTKMVSAPGRLVTNSADKPKTFTNKSYNK